MNKHLYKTIIFILLLIAAAHILSLNLMDITGETSTFIAYQSLVTLVLSFFGVWLNKLIRFPTELQRKSNVKEYVQSVMLGSIFGATTYAINEILRFDSMRC